MKIESRAHRTAVLCGVLAIGAAACNRSTPVVEDQKVVVEQKDEPTSASGCLRTGMADNTFVLMSPGSQPGQESATYQLTGHKVDLRQYVGQEVNVAGTVRAVSEVASSTAPVQDTPKGTSGTPTIETKSELTVKQMTVESVSATGGRCAPAVVLDDQPDRRIK
jgi:hypothetical protein